jgi:predicted trehalose synthase
MSDPNGQESFGRTVLSLLVAADQCCPAIIGQAHLLYHSGSTTREEAWKIFATLKREADELGAALARVEAAFATASAKPADPLAPQQRGTRSIGGPVS